MVSIDDACRAPTNSGREASAYLRFVIEYYDNLPDYIAFLHGHEHGWHQKYPGSLFEAIKHVKKEEYDFISLNLLPVVVAKPAGDPYWSVIHSVWPRFFEPYVGKPVPAQVEMVDVGAQFLVNKARILKYPKEQWKQWLDLTQNQNILGFHEFRYMPWVFEYTWHAIFGEEWEYHNHETNYANRFTAPSHADTQVHTTPELHQ